MFDVLEYKTIDDWKPYLAGVSANHSVGAVKKCLNLCHGMTLIQAMMMK